MIEVKSQDSLYTSIVELPLETTVEVCADDILSVSIGGIKVNGATTRIWVWKENHYLQSAHLINSSGLDPPLNFLFLQATTARGDTRRLCFNPLVGGQ